MNLSMSDVRTQLTTWFNWWLGGWQDAWAMLPKPSALQARPEVFQTAQGGFLTCITKPGESTTWQNVSRPDALRGLLIDDEQILFRELTLPSLSERDIAAAVAMDVQIASPFPVDDTCYGFRTHRQPNGSLRIEIALTRKSQLEHIHPTPTQPALFARGKHGAIALRGDIDHTANTTLRSPLTLSLLTLLSLTLIAWIISPTLLLRAQAKAHENTLTQLNHEASPLLQKRDELNALQQQLEYTQKFSNEHPNPVQLLEQLSAQIPDNTWVKQLSLRKDQLTLEGISDNAIAVVSLLEKIQELKEVRLGTSVNRDPRNGKETFQILARVQTSAPAATTNGVAP